MTIEQIRAQIVSSIWQAVAQSGVDLSSLSSEQQDKLVRAIAERLMETMNTMLDDVAAEAAVAEAAAGEAVLGLKDARLQPEEAAEPAQVDEGSEQVLWQGRPFLSLVENYIITSERLKITHGLLSRQVENFELIRIQDIDLTQGVGERMVGIGDISIKGADTSQPHIILRNIQKPEEVYEILRRAWLDARKRYGLQFREYM